MVRVAGSEREPAWDGAEPNIGGGSATPAATPAATPRQDAQWTGAERTQARPGGVTGRRRRRPGQLERSGAHPGRPGGRAAGGARGRWLLGRRGAHPGRPRRRGTRSSARRRPRGARHARLLERGAHPDRHAHRHAHRIAHRQQRGRLAHPRRHASDQRQLRRGLAHGRPPGVVHRAGVGRLGARRPARRGRHGRGVPGQADLAQAPRRDQGALAQPRRRHQAAAALPARGAHDLDAVLAEPGAGVRGGGMAGQPLLRHGVRRRHRPAPPSAHAQG